MSQVGVLPSQQISHFESSSLVWQKTEGKPLLISAGSMRVAWERSVSGRVHRLSEFKLLVGIIQLAHVLKLAAR